MLPDRFSVELFKTLELDKGIVYKQGDWRKLHKNICIPSFEQARSMQFFVGANKAKLDVLLAAFQSKAYFST